MDDFGHPALARLLAALPDAVLSTHARLGDATAQIDPVRLVEVLGLLRDDPALEFEMLMDVTAVDYRGEEPRFEVVYHLYSVARNHRVRIKARVSEARPEIDSVVSLYASANWMERETWDLLGIDFNNHPDRRRILMPDDWEGHPLRKDYPVQGPDREPYQGRLE